MLSSSSGNLPDLLLILCHLCLAINGVFHWETTEPSGKSYFSQNLTSATTVWTTLTSVLTYSSAIIWVAHLHIFLNKNANTEELMFQYMLHDMDTWKYYAKWMKPITGDDIHMISFIRRYPEKGNL